METLEVSRIGGGESESAVHTVENYRVVPQKIKYTIAEQCSNST
jgi:hypothetical protein